MIPFVTVFSEAIIFALYIFICLTLMKPRFPLRICVPIYGTVILCLCGALAAITHAGFGMEAFTLLPLIAYLPFSLCVYVLSDGGLFETAAACSVGALSSLAVKTFKKTLPILLNGLFYEASLDIPIMISMLILAAASVFIVFRYVRKSFVICTNTDVKNRLLVLIPTATVFLMIFINFSSVGSAPVLLTTLLMAISFFALASRLFVYLARISEADKIEKRLTESLALQRKSFEELSNNLEFGRHYRHDMRHHLTVLAGMARQNNSVEILEYINELSDATESGALHTYCKNPALNAVLSEFMNHAKNIGCRIEHKIVISEELPFDLPDISVIISNALENALHACEKCPEGMRYIDLTADFSDERKLKILVKNSCADNVTIDASGLPNVGKRTYEHGIGLRSVKRTVEKYNGFVSCSCENGEFIFLAEIFVSPDGSPKSSIRSRNRKYSKALPAVITSVVCVIAMLNFSPATANALSTALSVDIKTISYGWGDTGFKANYPEFSGEYSEDLNRVTKTFFDDAADLFWRYAVRKYEGYVSEDSGYQIITNNARYLSIRFYATLNVGGSIDYSRCVTVDKRNGKILELSDLFSKKRDYIAEISAEVLRQMKIRVENEGANYFIPGGIWSDDECFKEISADQDFYINPDGKLVIVFEEYSVAPGSEGTVEFIMPNEIFRYAVY